jgi:Domain of unknown function (DUF4157)
VPVSSLAMDSAETEDLAVDPERARHSQTAELGAPERFHDQRPPLENIASAIGNRGFGQMVARMSDGEGILEGGLVHPDVQRAIAASRGTGRPLDRYVSSTLETGLGESLSDVWVHTGDGAAALARAVSARAFTVGSDIFFAKGEYQPHSSGGRELIAHEVAHTRQQLGAPDTGPLTVSQPGDALEREAESVARDITA